MLYDLQHTVDRSGNRTVLQYENNANKQVTFTYNALNQVTGYSGTRGNKINVTGALPTAWALETVSVEPNSTPAKAVEADICGQFFVARNVELEDATDNSIEASADGTTLAGNSVASDTASSMTFAPNRGTPYLLQPMHRARPSSRQGSGLVGLAIRAVASGALCGAGAVQPFILRWRMSRARRGLCVA